MRLLLIFQLILSVAADATWPTMLLDPTHSGTHGPGITFPASTPEVKWKYKASGEVESSAVIGDGLVYAAGGKNVFAVDQNTGKEVWSKKKDNQVLASGTLGGNAFMIGGDDRVFSAFEQKTGKPLWSFKGGEFTGGATVGEEEGVVYVGSGNNKLHAYYLNGTKRFEFKAADQVCSTPALDSGGIYFGDDKGVLYKLDRATGKKVWDVKFDSNIRSPVKLHSDGIFIGIGDPDGKKSGEIILLDYNGKVIWRADCGRKKGKCGSCWTSPAVVGDVVVAGCGLDGIKEGHIWGLDKASGKVRWSFKAKNDCQTSSPVAAEHAVMLGCTDGLLYNLDARDGSLIWQFKASKGIWATPAIGKDGTIYIGSHDGYLYALSDKPAASNEL